MQPADAVAGRGAGNGAVVGVAGEREQDLHSGVCAGKPQFGRLGCQGVQEQVAAAPVEPCCATPTATSSSCSRTSQHQRLRQPAGARHLAAPAPRHGLARRADGIYAHRAWDTGRGRSGRPQRRLVGREREVAYRGSVTHRQWRCSSRTGRMTMASGAWASPAMILMSWR